MIRTVQQNNYQQFAVEELATSEVVGPAQLSFKAFIEDDRFSRAIAAKLASKDHRATTVFDPGQPITYRFVETASVPRVRFCWTVERNAAGRFLIFRERRTKKRLVRDRIEPILNKRAAIAACVLYRDQFEALRARRRANDKRG